jgi:hypothetical protein
MLSNLAPQVHVMIVAAQSSEEFHSRFGPQGLTSETLPHLYLMLEMISVSQLFPA